MKIAKNNTWIILLAPFLIAASIILVGLFHYGINLPFWDEWEMVTIFQDADHHHLTFDDFWRQHNEHRIFFPNIVLTSAAYVTHWNVKAELLINFFFSIITALMLYLFVLQKIRQRYLAILASVLIAAWYFSPVQYENWLWGWQVEWFMAVAGNAVAIFLLDRFATLKQNSNLLLGGAIASGIIATFSLGSGILVWPVGLGILLVYRQRKQPIIAWLIAALASTCAYYYHYHKPEADPSTTLFLHQRTQFFQYILEYFGRPINSAPEIARVVGAIFLLLAIPMFYMVWLQRAKISKFVPWLSLMVLALGAGFLTDISRLGLGVEQSSASRYTAFSLLYIIGLTGLAAALLDIVKLKKEIRVVVVLIALAVSVPLLFSSYTNGRSGFRIESYSLKNIYGCTHTRKPTDACLFLTYPHADVTRPRLEYLKAKHWAGY